MCKQHTFLLIINISMSPAVNSQWHFLSLYGDNFFVEPSTIFLEINFIILVFFCELKLLKIRFLGECSIKNVGHIFHTLIWVPDTRTFYFSESPRNIALPLGSAHHRLWAFFPSLHVQQLEIGKAWPLSTPVTHTHPRHSYYHLRLLLGNYDVNILILLG